MQKRSIFGQNRIFLNILSLSIFFIQIKYHCAEFEKKKLICRFVLGLQVPPCPQVNEPFYFPKMPFYFQNCSFIFQNYSFIFQKYPFLSWSCPFVFQKCPFVFQRCLFISQKCLTVFQNCP